MSFAKVLERKDDAVFRRFGEDALYIAVNGQRVEGVRVIRKEPDVDLRFADSRAIVPSCVLRFRRAQVATPSGGDRLILTDDSGELEYVLHADPMINARRSVWTCGADVMDVSR